MRGTNRISSRAFPSYEVIIESIKRHHGLLSIVAEDLGVARSPLSRVASRRAVIGRALHDAREKMGDFAESRLFKLIDLGNQRAIEFYLASVHRRRGYGPQPGEALNVGDTTNLVIQKVIITPIASGRFVDHATTIEGESINGEIVDDRATRKLS
jgi:hypothetical protein